MSVGSEVLKDMVTKYLEATDGVVKSRAFERILARVDRLLIEKALQMQNRYSQLDSIDAQDLYHCAVVGLYRALDGVKPHNSGDNIQARIISYAKEEIRRTYLGKKRRMFTIDPDTIVDIHSDEPPEFTRIEINELIAGIKSMLDDGDIDQSDFNMLVDNSVNGLSFSEIGRRRHLHYTTVSNRVKRVRLTIAERLG